MPGLLLLRFARALCSPARCANVLEPAIADLQHDRRYARGYAAFWRSFAECLVRDAIDPASTALLTNAFAAFAGVLVMSAGVETVVMHSHRLRAALPSVPWIGWYALSSSATLVWMAPIAIAPALLYGRRRSPASPGVASVAAAVAGVCLSIASWGWIAPAIERRDIVRQHAAFKAANHGRFAERPVEWELDRSSSAKSLPNLVGSALAPPAHRFAGYPNYVAPEDQGAHEAFWLDLRFRLILVLLSSASALLGVKARTIRAAR